jgi:hypothetical protein
MEVILVRYSEPSQYDHAPQGTKCRVHVNKQIDKWYVQVSPKEDEPKWIETNG